jgi:TRAP-type C4-dicarboxylate transport system permease small subunit
MKTIKNIFSGIYNTHQTKIFLFFSIISIIISAIKYKSIIVIGIQLIIYYFITKEINCKIYGGCTISSWITTIIPIVGIIIFMLDYFHMFKNIKTKLKYIQHKYEEISPERIHNY